MNATKQATWLFLLLFVLAIFSWYYATNKKAHQLNEQTLEHLADIKIHNLTVTKFNLDGKIENILVTSFLHHIPYGDSYYLKNPYISIAQTNQPNWQIKAKKAIATNNGEQIKFMKKVIIYQEATIKTPASTLTTEELTYFNKTKYASTDKLVHFAQADTIVNAEGLNAYLNEKKVKLLKNVHTIFHPKST